MAVFGGVDDQVALATTLAEEGPPAGDVPAFLIGRRTESFQEGVGHGHFPLLALLLLVDVHPASQSLKVIISIKSLRSS